MVEDREILREIWEGRLPICFSLAQEDVYTLEQPDPFYLLVPRQSYFPLVTDKVQRHFSKFTNSDKLEEMWLDFEGTPLKWHYPLGVLFDLHASHTTLPWNITVHFHNFPSDDLLFCHGKDVVEAHFMSVMKEADFLKHRGTIINNLQRKDHKQLWVGLHNDKFEQFWSINRKLMDSSGDLTFRFIPFRIYQPDEVVIQQLFRPVSETGHQHCLADLLTQFLPTQFSTRDHSGLLPSQRLLIQGIDVPLDTPIVWLSIHFSHPDNFLHICILDQLSISQC